MAGQSWMRAVYAGLVLAWAAGAMAQNVGLDGGAEKIVEVVRDDEVPDIDGVLDEAVWARAVLIEDLHQLDPEEYATPSQPTEIRLFYGKDALYVAARLWDSEADQITAQVLRQGEGLGSEDRFAVILDPYLNRRDGYRFQVNPNGVRWEAFYQDTSNLESSWNGIWLGAATRDAEGWTAEMAIPFKTISFNPNLSRWGINFERTIQRNDETLGWVSRNRQLNPSIAGTAVGFADLEQGRGLDIVPSLTVSDDKSFVANASGDTNFEPSVDIFYKLTPSLNAALTFNTDFSATEVDDRQVNLTRFSLFFPEKRDFFLQDADIFEFGRIGGGGFNRGNRGAGGNPAIPGASAQNGRPFFSRRIGLSPTGTPIDIEYGGKLSGRAGRWNLGALAIHQDRFDTGDPATSIEAGDIFVGRATANVLQESAIGIVATDGDPQSNDENSLIGTDFRYRNSRLPGGRLIEAQAWYQESDSIYRDPIRQAALDPDKQSAYGYGIGSPNTTGWRGAFSSRTIEQNFDPAVGFVNRRGIRDYAMDFGYRHRPALGSDSWLRSIYAGVDAYRVDRLDTGGLESENIGVRITMQNNTQDGIFFRAVENREVLPADFTIYRSANGLNEAIIRRGDYSFSNFRLGTDTGSQRKFSARGSISWGNFYDGRQRNANANMNWRPSERLRFGLSYRVDDVSLPEYTGVDANGNPLTYGGDFTVRVTSLNAQLVFSSTLSWVNLIQYDNVSETVGFNSRLHWIPEAGREGFIVLNHNLSDMDQNDSFHSVDADMSIKFSYTFRF